MIKPSLLNSSANLIAGWLERYRVLKLSVGGGTTVCLALIDVEGR